MAAQAAAGTATPEARYDAALAMLTKHCDEYCSFGLGADPSAVNALDAMWDASQDWTIAFLQTHPGIAPQKLAAELRKAQPKDRTSVAPVQASQIAPGLYGFAAQWGETGNVFLVGQRNSRWTVIWDARKADPGKFAIVKAWRTRTGQLACRQNTKNGLECGPLFGAVYGLMPDAEGRARFAIHATYAQLAGETVANQISFWRWDGSNATPLLAKTFTSMIEDMSSDFQTDRIHLRGKNSFKSFLDCGACVGRQIEWTFRVLPDRILDEGQKPLYPELDTVDAVLERYLTHKRASDLASPAAIKVLDTMFAAAEGESPDLGLEGDRKITPTASGADVCLSTDGFLATHFILERRERGFWLSQVRRTDAENCTQPAKK